MKIRVVVHRGEWPLRRRWLWHLACCRPWGLWKEVVSIRKNSIFLSEHVAVVFLVFHAAVFPPMAPSSMDFPLSSCPRENLPNLPTSTTRIAQKPKETALPFLVSFGGMATVV